MLGADLVDARKKDGALVLRPLTKELRREALGFAERYLAVARASVGEPRDVFDDACDDVDADAAAGARKLALGLRKLVEDACVFECRAAVDPVEVRRAVFVRAAAARRAGTFDRAAVLGEAGAALGIDGPAVERGLFADLKGEHVLTTAPIYHATSLVDAWALAREQAVLLASTRVVCEVRSASPGLLRAFFAKLKFHQLLFAAESLGDGAWRVTLDGPYSMFDAVTKYGLRLALVLPALRALERWSLVADVRWGKERVPLSFTLEGGRESPEGGDDLHVNDDVRELAEGFGKTGWGARIASTILDVPGAGVCIPDLELEKDGTTVYVEVLGFWSRDAVWRRVELVERGLGARIVFAVSERLRVSPEVIDGERPASLYVYKGKMSVRALLEHVERVASR